jgi:hypothetical protein
MCHVRIRERPLRQNRSGARVRFHGIENVNVHRTHAPDAALTERRLEDIEAVQVLRVDHRPAWQAQRDSRLRNRVQARQGTGFVNICHIYPHFG